MIGNPREEFASDLPDKTAYELFVEQAQRTPDRVAVTDGKTTLTYRLLEQRIDQIASALVDQHVAEDTCVGILVERNADMVACAYAVWKLGAAYVPIDTSTPAERLAFVLQDSAAVCVLISSSMRETVVATDLPTINVDVDVDVSASTKDTVPNGSQSPNALAYVMYTSGTTGQPKGVLIEQRSVVNLAHAHQRRIYRHHFGAEDAPKASFTASLAFDGSVERLLLLAYGCTLFVLDDVARSDPREFVSFVRKNKLDVLDVTPAFLASAIEAGLLNTGDHGPKVVLIGGEAIPSTLWGKLASEDIAFYNVYGPTECTVNAAVGRITGSEPHLGLPLANVQVYILDQGLSPVENGEIGEIFIAGFGVGRGYLNRPELNNTKFIDNPFADHPDFARMYATGDLGRFRKDGTIDFLGRNDGQVKLRGYRIETDEIARTLESHELVTQAIVTLHGQAESAHLVSYIVGELNRQDLAPTLKSHLGQSLPSYMVPNVYVPIESVPLTVNGKVDHAALAEIAASYMQTATQVDSHNDESETVSRLKEIWKSLLAIDDVGPSQNFFEVGGHSLLVVAMLTEAENAFGVELPMAVIFTAPSLGELANEIDQRRLA